MVTAQATTTDVRTTDVCSLITPSEEIWFIGEDDIDKLENTLILYKPVEWGFDTFRICFLENEAGELVCHLLDDSYRNVTLVSVAASEIGAGYVAPTMMNLDMTFGDLDGKKLVFQGEGRPFTRYLNFQAKQAFHRAQKMTKEENTFIIQILK